jgi:Dyp-type peroxidase family
MEALEKNDIQGFVLKGYGTMRHTRYAILHVDDAALAKAWLSQISLEVSDGNHHARHTSLNIAFGYPGLKALGLRDDNLRQFTREFREGLTNAHRQRLLGDEGEDSPANWRWGGMTGDARAENVHILLMVFAATETILTEYWTQLEPVILNHGLSVISKLDGSLSPDNKEAFGFHDGISQPQIVGYHPDTNPHDTVAAGEFLLGYKNEYGVYPESPIIPATEQQGDTSLLPTIGPNQKDLGRNGSYLVFRQMQQHVDRFWNFMRANTPNEPEAIKLASKMIGRWPSGAPLVLFPDKDPGEDPSVDPKTYVVNDYGYARQDKEGLRCPFGAHMRRANPRDVFEDNGPALSESLTKKHRIIRRGRGYRLSIPAEPGQPPQEEVGLHFMCFNADIAHQFEFIQHTWANFPRFDRLHNDPDPIIGTVGNPPHGLVQDFTVPQCPVNRHVHNLQRFVTIRGGVYLFCPSINAIKYFASI